MQDLAACFFGLAAASVVLVSVSRLWARKRRADRAALVRSIRNHPAGRSL